MADLKYLDGAGVQYLWNQIRASFATMSDLPTKVSQLNNDLGFLNSNEVNYAINAAIQSLSIPSKVSDLTNDAGYQTAQDVASAIGSLNIPTKTSDLNNDSDFQTGTEVGSAISTAIGALNIPTDTGDLTNSVEFQTLSEVTALINQAISGITSLHFEVVQTLPVSGDAMTIYLVPKGSALLTNVYDEYIWYNNSWELIGDTAVDLTNYIQKGSTFNNSRATATDASGNLVTTDTTATELGYLHGVTGDLQTQINGKAATSDVTAKQDIMQFDTMPTASVSNAGDIVQYTGGTSGGFTNGYFYKCVENSGTYSWVQTDVQPSQSGAASESEIAPVEATTTASRAYAVGDLLIYNGTLYRVTTAIASGGTITPGTNCTATSVSDVFVRKTGDTMSGGLVIGSLKASTTLGNCAFAQGYNVEASGSYSHAEGDSTTATSRSHAEGNSTTASQLGAHAEGSNSVASNSCSHAEGQNTTASGVAAHAEGYYSTASSWYSHAEGNHTSATANNTHASGNNTVAGYANQFVCGLFNDNKSTDIFEVGNGRTDAPSNALELTETGNLTVAGDVTDGSGNKLSTVLGKKLTGTVSGTSLAFTDASITATAVIDGPYIADVLIGITAVATSGTTVTYTFADNTANGKAAYIWVR